MAVDAGIHADLTFGVLGAFEARRGDVPLNVGGTKQRIVLASLALDPGRAVSADKLIFAVWGDDVPAKAVNTLQVYLSNLRKILAPADGDRLLRHQRPGYLLDVGPDAVDVGRFTRLVRQAQGSQRGGDLVAASRVFGQALAQWRGPALSDLADEPFAAGVIARLEADRLAAVEEHIEVDLALGRHASLVGPLQRLVADHPLRERPRGQLMLALYRSGRQSEALQAYREGREQLADQLGIDPGPELRRLEQAILQQSPSLLHAPAPTFAESTVSVGREHGPVTAWLVVAGAERRPLSKGRLLVGRADDNDIVLPDVKSSRRHAMIRSTGGRHEVVDLDSTNGTWVNGFELQPNQPRLLEDGDDVVIGGTHLGYARQPVD